MTFTFGRPVTGLAFTLVDIDSATASWYDMVELSGVRTGVAPLGSSVIGLGINGDPWRHSSANTNVATTANGGNLSVTYPGSLTSFTLDYYSSIAGTTQVLLISDFTFTALGC